MPTPAYRSPISAQRVGCRLVRILVVILILGAPASAAKAPAGRWLTLSNGLEFLRWRVARYDSTNGTGYCRIGEPYVAVLRIDPRYCRFSVHYRRPTEARAELPNV